MGNLGWDISYNELQSEIARVLHTARVPPEAVLAAAPSCPRGRKGSGGDIVFRNLADLEEARLLLRTAGLEGKTGQEIFLDVALAADA